MNPPKEILLDLHISPPDLFSAILENSQDAFLLESSEGPKKLARFSFIGFLPYSHMSLKNGCLKIDGEETDTKNPLLHLKNEVGKSSFKGQGFLGGAVGYFSFDYVRYIENFQSSPNDEVNFPDFEFGMFSDAVVFDHRKGTIKYIYSNENRLELLLSYIKDASFSNDAMQMYNQKCKVGKEKFLSMVNTAKEYIKAGEIFQVVLSNRYEIKFVGSLVPFYKKLKAINPSPYLYYLKFGDRQLIGSSPENLFRLEGKEITSYATIAGQRRARQSKEGGEGLEGELLSDEKERAEHLMLVDL
ncbi:MAG: chorismate-binding protein, partial [Candidatus Bilamarchaeaceae archaeon]